uniref:TSA: Wollemia nobilis Ref_Wollemi_Transcript_21704_2563 transcribed RNA sequence n=1 Tax=Wollemia nobilis TaxID=56998 RepID=A0A0C9RHM9_9CONI
MAGHNSKSRAQAAAETAIGAIGRGYDITNDLRLSYCKGDGRLIELDGDGRQNAVVPGGVIVPNVSKAIKCDKGERMRFRSDVLPFQQMSEQFNQELDIPGKIPSGLFNAMFEFTGSWQKDASGTKHLAFDGWFITLYSIGLTRSHVGLRNAVKKEVPAAWDPAALAGFIEKYGTHVIIGIKMGGKDVIFLKQQHTSNLQATDVQKLLKRIADERFSDANGRFSLNSEETSRRDKVADSLMHMNQLRFMESNGSTSHSVKEDIIKIFKRRGGIEPSQSHHQWLATVPSAPDVISMSFVPITSLLNGVPGTGFLSHAVNLYLRYKPPIEELHQFLEFQLPRQWAPVFSELPLGPQRKEHGKASLQFSLMGPKLYVNTSPVNVGKRPVTGVRLYLEGKKCNRLAIHLQHLSTLPKILQLLDDDEGEPEESNRKYYEPVQWKSFSHVCTAPVECSGTLIGDPASIVTGAQLEVRVEKMKKVLFLKLCFSRVFGASIRRSEWDNSPNISQKSGIISTLISTHFSSAQQPPKPTPVVINSAIYPGGPPVPVQVPKLLKFVDTTELTKGPQDMPGHWVVTGAKLCVDGGKISLRVKYSLLTISLEDSS